MKNFARNYPLLQTHVSKRRSTGTDYSERHLRRLNTKELVLVVLLLSGWEERVMYL